MALSGNEIFQITGVDGAGRPSGTTETVSTLQLATYALSGAVPTINFGYSQVFAAGTNQATATPVTTDVVLVIATAPGQGIILPPSSLGAQKLIVNASAFTLLVYPQGTNNFLNQAPSTPFYIPAEFSSLHLGIAAGEWTATIGNVPSSYAYNTNAAIGSSAISAASLVGNIGFVETTLAFTGAITGAMTATLPTVTSLASALFNPFAGQSWKMHFVNESSTNNTITLAANTGWTITGTATISQNTSRDFYLTMSSLTSAGLQCVGVGTFS